MKRVRIEIKGHSDDGVVDTSVNGVIIENEGETVLHVLPNPHLDEEGSSGVRLGQADLLLVVLGTDPLEGTVLGEGDSVLLHMG